MYYGIIATRLVVVAQDYWGGVDTDIEARLEWLIEGYSCYSCRVVLCRLEDTL